MKIKLGKYYLNLNRTGEAIVEMVGTIVIVWGVVSWMEIILKNTAPNPIYWDWNLWIRLIVR